MPRQDELDFLGCFQRHHEVSVLLTGNAEDVLDLFFFETLYEQIRCFHDTWSFAVKNSSLRREARVLPTIGIGVGPIKTLAMNMLAFFIRYFLSCYYRSAALVLSMLSSSL